MRNAYEDVYPYGCGWDLCPICGPTIALLKEKEHRRIANRTGPDMHDAPATRREGMAKVKVKRVLTDQQRAEALTLLAKRPIMRLFRNLGKGVWLTEVWLELENPSVLCAKREAGLDLKTRINRAVKRAEKRLYSDMLKSADEVPTDDFSHVADDDNVA